jgi:hypothetical protein
MNIICITRHTFSVNKSRLLTESNSIWSEKKFSKIFWRSIQSYLLTRNLILTAYNYFINSRTFIKFKCFTNFWCFWKDNNFVKSSTIIFVVSTYSTWRWLFCIISLNQHWATSTCLSFMSIRTIFDFIRRIVCKLFS